MQKSYPDAFTRAMHALPAELAHDITLASLRYLSGLVPKTDINPDHGLAGKYMGLHFQHPICLAAGFDKNADAISALWKFGFSAMEIGSVTLNPQPGNPRPRLFRLPEQKGLINRMGFNSDGVERVAENLSQRPEGFIIGANLGLNKGVTDYEKHFSFLARKLAQCADYITINLSSPNTLGLRSLLDPQHVAPILSSVIGGMAEVGLKLPIVLKLSPDMDHGRERELLEFLAQSSIQGIIASNTTVDRSMLPVESQFRRTQGGLSGPPLAANALRLLNSVRSCMPNSTTIIASGGITTGQDIFERLAAGAHLVQIYTGFVFGGRKTVAQLLHGLQDCMQQAGVNSISEIHQLR